MADFAKYFPLLLANEGGYVNDPRDPGGETWCGIARKSNGNWAGWAVVDGCKARADWPADGQVSLRNKLATAVLAQVPGLADVVKSFYLAHYWKAVNLDGIANQSIASQLCDIGVNSGTGRVGRIAQYVLQTSFNWKGTLDGQIGPATLAAINAAPATAYYNALVTVRRAFYQYRAGRPVESPKLVAFLKTQLSVQADSTMQRFLASWMGRINAIPFSA